MLTTFKSRGRCIIAVLIGTIGMAVVNPLGTSSTSSILLAASPRPPVVTFERFVSLAQAASHIDSAFNAGGGGPNSDVLAVAMQPDGRIVIGGFFTSYNGDFAASDHVMRLNADGTRDATFNAGGEGANTTVSAVAVQPDGKILIAGQFTSYNGDETASDYVMRLNVDGTRDTTFNAGGSGANDYAWGFALQPDGKILVAGNFFTYNGNPTSWRVMRLNTDGTRDTTFNAGGTGANGTVSAVAVQPDGKIVIAGLFTSYNGDAAASDYVMRLNSDGTRDTSFNPIGTGADNWVQALAVQSDGKIVIGGDFAGYNGDFAASDRVMRLNADGTRDATFNAGGTGADVNVSAISVQPDGKIIIGGLFTGYNGDAGASNYLIRLNTDGRPDTTFNPGGAGANARVYGLALQPDGRIVVGGQFTAYNGDFAIPAHVIRLLSTPTTTPVCSAVPDGIISWWPGGGNAQDVVGHFDGALQNGATFGTGIVGQAFSLDGIDDAIVVNDNAALNPASITVEAWVRPTSVPAGQIADVVTKWGFDATIDSWFLGLRHTGGVVRVLAGIGDGATGDPGLTGGTVTLNAWNHIAMTYDAASGVNRVFVNGVPVGQRVRANGIYPTTKRVFIGREDSNNNRFFSGLIDEPTIYSRALTDAEILAIYNAGGNGKCGESNTNQPPVANDDSATVRQTNSVSIPVLANDTDPDGDALQFVGHTQPGHGTIEMFVADVLVYTPNAGFLGSDSFTYTIADAAGLESTATVLISVTEGLAPVHINVLFEDAGLALGEQACFELLRGSSVVRGPQCINAAQNVIVFNDVPLGSYTAAVSYSLSLPPALPQPQLPNRYAVPAAVPVELTRDGLNAFVTIQPRLRKLVVGATDQSGNGLTMCYRLSPVSAASGAPVQEACTVPVLGVPIAAFANVWSGIQYRLEITDRPAGLIPLPGQEFQSVGPFDHTTEVNTATFRLTRDVLVRLIDPSGNLVSGQCIAIDTDAVIPGEVARACDGGDGAVDGVAHFAALNPGNYRAIPRPFPPGPYAWTASGAAFTVSGTPSGQVVTYQLQPARTAVVTMRDTAGRPAPNGCLGVTLGGLAVGEPGRCDGDDGTVDSVVHFEHLPNTAGQIVAGSTAPAGLTFGDAVPLIYSGSHATATYVWQLAPAITAVRLEAPDGTLLPGQCMTVYEDRQFGFAFTRCDAADGRTDGVTEFQQLSENFVGWATRPSPFPPGPYAWSTRGVGFFIPPTPTEGVVVTYRLEAARTATVTMRDTAGRPVPGACLGAFVELWTLGESPRCDGDDGTVDSVVHFDHLPSWGFQQVGGSVEPAGLTFGDAVPLTYSGTHAAATYVWRLAARIPTETTLSSSSNPSLTTAPPIFTVTVNSSGQVTGQVEFLQNGVVFGTRLVFPRGPEFVAVMGGTDLGVAGNTYTITARYLGDATHGPSESAPIEQTVRAGRYFEEVVSGVPGGFMPVAINDLEQIAGNRGAGALSRAAVYDPVLGYRWLGPATGYSQVFDLNQAGTIVGRIGNDATATSGVVFGDGSPSLIDRSTAAVGVNTSEQIAVQLIEGEGAGLYQNGGVTFLGGFEPRAINDAGDIAGSFDPGDGQPTAMRWQSGGVTELGRFGQAFASATHVSNDGSVLVQGGDENGVVYPTLIRNDAEIPLDTGRAWDINDAGVVAAGETEARVFINGHWTTLAAGRVAGMAINNLGQVAGTVSNQLRLWTPVPTSSLVVSPVSGVQDDETTLTATLTSDGAAAVGYSIAFSLNGRFVGTATTNSDGVAVLEGASLCCLSAGVHPNGVHAAFSGNRTLGAATATAQLTLEALNPADVSVSASTPTPVVTIGSNHTYSVTMSNAGPTSAFVLRLNVTLPAGLQYVSDSALGSCSWSGGLGTCDFDNVAGGSTRAIAITARTVSGAPQTASFVVSAPQHDPNPANNTALVTVDARPTVTINQAANQGDPAITAPIFFTVVFSEPVAGFTGADVSFAGSTVGINTLAATVTGSGTTYTASVSGMARAGLVVASIPAGAAVDSGGNPSAASTSTDNTVLYGVSTAIAIVTPSNGGNATVTAMNLNGQLSGMLFYRRGSFVFSSARFTSFVINGQTATLQGFSSDSRFFVATIGDGQPETFRLWVQGVEQTAGGAIASGTTLVVPWAADTRLKGWVDLHTHPMSNLAFGGKLFHGAPSVGSLMPAVQMPGDPECRFDQRATSINEALSQDGPTRGDPIQSRCGDFARRTLIGAIELFNNAQVAPTPSGGFPAFTHWPKWNDITHQKMWIDWIRRSWEGGQRVMVALSHNNRTVAELLGGGGPISGVRNDVASSDLQIEEIKQLVAANSDFMAVATTPGELHAIVSGGHLAVVLGVELDRIGDFGTYVALTDQTINDEIDRLFAQGVRYVLPMHFIDNAFGDAAVYQGIYNIVNYRENQTLWTVGCAQFADQVGFRLPALPAILNVLVPPGMPIPIAPPCMQGPTFLGHKNTRLANGLVARGEFAIRAMMRRGMIVDIDHMSDRAANRAIAIANAVPAGGYPLTSGHTAVRDRNTPPYDAENSRTTAQLARIACLGGMFGIGTDGIPAYRWAAQYQTGYNAMRVAFAPNGFCPSSLPLGDGFIGLGTDANSLVKSPPPTMVLNPPDLPRFTDIYNPNNPINAGVPPLTRSTTGDKTWDYNADGVAHYGMFVDFLRDVRTFSPGGAMPGRQMVDDQMMYGAEYFYRMWLKADTQKARVP